MARTPSLDPTIVDAASLFDASEFIGERVGRKVTLNYANLRERLDSLRKERGWRPAKPNWILLSIDPNSEGQKRFEGMLKHSGFEVDVVHFRDTFVSPPPGRSPSEVTGKSMVSLAPRIAYIAGLMAARADTEFLVVSHSFELSGPLADLRHRIGNGKVGLAYFGSLLDYRWKVAGLFDGKLGVDFFDLDEYGDHLMGIDLAGPQSGAADARAGLSRF